MDNNVNIRLLDMVPEKYIYLDLDAEEENRENPAQVKATLHELQLKEETEEEKPKENPVIKIPSESKNTKFDIDLDKLKAELKSGTSIKKIAALFGCSDQTIYNTMHRHGIAFDGYPEGAKK